MSSHGEATRSPRAREPLDPSDAAAVSRARGRALLRPLRRWPSGGHAAQPPRRWWRASRARQVVERRRVRVPGRQARGRRDRHSEHCREAHRGAGRRGRSVTNMPPARASSTDGPARRTPSHLREAHRQRAKVGVSARATGASGDGGAGGRAPPTVTAQRRTVGLYRHSVGVDGLDPPVGGGAYPLGIAPRGGGRAHLDGHSVGVDGLDRGVVSQWAHGLHERISRHPHLDKGARGAAHVLGEQIEHRHHRLVHRSRLRAARLRGAAARRAMDRLELTSRASDRAVLDRADGGTRGGGGVERGGGPRAARSTTSAPSAAELGRIAPGSSGEAAALRTQPRRPAPPCRTARSRRSGGRLEAGDEGAVLDLDPPRPAAAPPG